MAKTVHFAIVGMGHIAKKHIEAIKKADNAELIAVCDTNEDQLKQFQGKIATYTDLDDMLKNCQEIDVVNICVPSGLHCMLAKKAVEQKKHLIVEKPIALTSRDAEEMILTAEQNKVKLAVVHPNRFRPAIRKLYQKIQDNGFGKLSHANATVRWNRNQAYYDQAKWRGTKKFDGGVLMNQAIHNLDLLLWLMGPVESVQGMAATRLRKIETEDVAAAVVRFQNGALGVIEAATTVFPQNLEESIAVFGETGSAKISGRNANFIETWIFDDVSEDDRKKLVDEIEDDPFGKPGHQWIIEDMVEAISKNRDPIVTGKDGLAPVRLIEAILESAEKGERIKL